MIHPKIRRLAPLVITDIPRDRDTFIQFLTLTGEYGDNYWSNEYNILDELHTQLPSCFSIPEEWDNPFFSYNLAYQPSYIEGYPHYTAYYTAYYIMSLVQSQTLYMRPSRS